MDAMSQGSSSLSTGSAASTHTLDSGIGTFPLPDYTGSMLGIPRVKPHQERDTSVCCGRPGTKASRRTRTQERELSALEEAPPRDAEQNRETLYAAALEENAPAAPLSCTITGGKEAHNILGSPSQLMNDQTCDPCSWG